MKVGMMSKYDWNILEEPFGLGGLAPMERDFLHGSASRGPARA